MYLEVDFPCPVLLAHLEHEFEDLGQRQELWHFEIYQADLHPFDEDSVEVLVLRLILVLTYLALPSMAALLHVQHLPVEVREQRCCSDLQTWRWRSRHFVLDLLWKGLECVLGQQLHCACSQYLLPTIPGRVLGLGF